MSPGLPLEAYALGLTALSPALGPRRLRELLAGYSPADAWAAIHAESLPDPLVASTRQPDPAATRAAWRESAIAVDLDALWDRSEAMGARVAVLGHRGYP